MVSIGIRVTHNEVFYAIVKKEIDEEKVISISSIKVINSLDESSKLMNIRNILITLIEQYNISRAGIKLMESNANVRINDSIMFRLNIEGVIKEVFSESSIKKYLMGRANNISAIYKSKCKKVLELSKELNIDSCKTDNGRKVTDNYKEAIVVAIASLRQE